MDSEYLNQDSPFSYTSPYFHKYENYSSVTLFKLNLDAKSQMNCIRFPTPPITPPKEDSLKAPIRTQSVIMKLDQGGRHIPNMLQQISSCLQSEKISQSTEFSNSNFICKWIGCKM